MFDQKVIIAEQFPVPETSRKHTDVCCTVISAILALSLFVTALIVYSPSKFQEKFNSFDFNLCKSGYLHFPNVDSTDSKICLNACPQGFGATNDQICVPYDTKLQEKFYKNTNIIKQRNYQGFKQTLFYAFIVSLGIGLLWVVLVFAVPKYAPIIAGTGGIIILIVITIFALLSTQTFQSVSIVYKYFIIGISVLLAFVLFGMIFAYSSQLQFQGTLLKYSNMFLFENQLTFIYIPIFLVLTFGLIMLIWFQNMAFQSHFSTKNNNQWDYSNAGLLSILNILEFIWGLQFLRDSFHFCISGNAVDWYWKGKVSTFAPLMRLLCRHWGSVVGGSFLNAFFQVPTLFVQLLVCHPKTCCSKAGTCCQNSCNPFTCFFEIVRTDAYSYINLSGIPFCNAARNCSTMCQKSNQFIGTYSSLKHYKLLVYILLVSLLCFMTQFILKFRTFSIDFWNICIGIIIIYATIIWFIDIHGDSAESLQTSYLVELQLQEGYQYMRRIRPSMRGELQFLDSRQKHDGSC